jgi:hypothetical protein
MDLQPGDIGAVKGRGLVPWLNRHLASPKTDRFHHLIAFLSVGFRIVDSEVVPVPGAFKKAEIEGKIYKIQS